MMPSRNRSLGLPFLLRWIGVGMLVACTYRWLAPGVHPAAAPWVYFAAPIGLFLFLWPLAVEKHS